MNITDFIDMGQEPPTPIGRLRTDVWEVRRVFLTGTLAIEERSEVDLELNQSALS